MDSDSFFSNSPRIENFPFRTNSSPSNDSLMIDSTRKKRKLLDRADGATMIKTPKCLNNIPQCSTPIQTPKVIENLAVDPVPTNEILKDVHAFVEVRSKWDDNSTEIGLYMEGLGATIHKTINKRVTHVVFKDGKPSTFKKATAMNKLIVPVLWLDSCRKQRIKVSEDLFVVAPPEEKATPLPMNCDHTSREFRKSFDRCLRKLKKLNDEMDAAKERINSMDFSKKRQEVATATSPSVATTTPRRKLVGKKCKKLSITPKKKVVSKEIVSKVPVVMVTKITERDTSPIIVPSDIPTNKNKVQRDDQKSRKSLDDFKIVDKNKSKKNKNQNKKVLVLTNVDTTTREIIQSVCRSFGGCRIDCNPSNETTHVLCGNDKRTLKILFGIAWGCWVLSPQWVITSLESGGWVGEEEFELSNLFPSASECRLERQLCTLSKYKQNIFNGMGKIFVSPRSSPPTEQLTKLIKQTGGNITTCISQCKIIVGEYEECKSKNVIRMDEKYILDCICEHKIL